MTTETIKIAKITKTSSNRFAWSNQFVGQTIEVIETNHTDYEGGYKVDFSKNHHISVPVSYISGILEREVCKIIG